jgi:hypothetical protein
VGEYRPGILPSPLGINRYYDALNTKGLGRSGNQFRLSDSSGVNTDLVGTRQQHFPHIRRRPDAAADRKWHKTLLGRPPDDIYHCTAIVGRSRDIQKYQFIGLLPIVFHRAFHWITCVAQLQKFGAFHHPAVGDIEARYDPFGEHLKGIVTEIEFDRFGFAGFLAD